MTHTRRQFLVDGVLTFASLPLALRAQTTPTGGSAPTFAHGVASGDPLADRVVLWTRVSPAEGSGPVRVRWRVGTDERLTQTVASGTAEAVAERDFTVKVDATGLRPGRTYFYAFDARGQESPVGRTKTLPEASVARLRMASVSCSNYPAGYFNVYRCLANRDDLDVIVHLGDYIYEFANGVYGDGVALGRVPRPATESVTLADYRMRYATYRTDPDLQEVHRRHPFIAVWDDHESANDSSPDGAVGHGPKDGDWRRRFAGAYRAYLEWLPIRESGDSGIKLYRRFTFGHLADLIMLDTRGLRDRRVAATDAEALNDPKRSILGAAQEAWLANELRSSQRAGRAWRLLGQQVLFSSVTPPFLRPQNVDVWAGYPAARTRLLDALAAERVPNLAFLTGDLHSSWALDVPKNPWAPSGSAALESVAVELVTPAISSPPLFATASARDAAPLMRIAAPHLKYLEGDSRGYVLLDVAAERLRAEWYHVPSVTTRSADEKRAMGFVVERGSSRLIAD